jgi:hypothetical protein
VLTSFEKMQPEHPRCGFPTTLSVRLQDILSRRKTGKYDLVLRPAGRLRERPAHGLSDPRDRGSGGIRTAFLHARPTGQNYPTNR